MRIVSAIYMENIKDVIQNVRLSGPVHISIRFRMVGAMMEWPAYLQLWKLSS